MVQNSGHGLNGKLSLLVVIQAISQAAKDLSNIILVFLSVGILISDSSGILMVMCFWLRNSRYSIHDFNFGQEFGQYA